MVNSYSESESNGKNGVFLLRLLVVACLFIGSRQLYSQNIKLTLKEVIDIAQTESYAAFNAKYLYRVEQLDFLDYRSDLMPHADLSLTPVYYRRYMTEVYNYDNLRYESVETQGLTSDIELELSQNIAATGGQLTVTSSLERYQKYQDGVKADLDFGTVPVDISYSQDLSDWKKYKWDKKIGPLEFKIAQKELVETCEDIAVDAVSYFFNLLDAQVDKDLSEISLENAKKLFEMSKLRGKIGAISRDDLLNLELKKINAMIDLEQSINDLESARLDLCVFLSLPTDTQLEVVSPESGRLEYIDPAKAQQTAIVNNPDFDEYELNLLEADENLYDAKQDRFDLSVSAGIGYNQNADVFIESYEDLLSKQNFTISMSLPIVDWGESKRNIKSQVLYRERVLEQNEYYKNVLLTSIQKKANSFNLRKRELYSTALADTIAQSALEATKQHFLLGKVNVTDLNQAEEARVSARTNYISALRNYWSQYYYMRSLCLYDFEKEESLMEQFDKLLEE
jgi:outer membrane protein TolC